MTRRYWTTAEVRTLRSLYPDTTNAVIGEELRRSRSAVNQMAIKLRLKKSPAFIALHARFPAGLVPWNKGMKGWNAGGRADLTKFRRGHRGARQKPVGTERMERDGLMVKVAEPNVWKPKARVVWEKHFGPIPQGCVVRLKDGDRYNCSPENLLLLSRRDHVLLNYRPRRPRRIVWIAPLQRAA